MNLHPASILSNFPENSSFFELPLLATHQSTNTALSHPETNPVQDIKDASPEQREDEHKDWKSTNHQWESEERDCRLQIKDVSNKDEVHIQTDKHARGDNSANNRPFGESAFSGKAAPVDRGGHHLISLLSAHQVVIT